MKLLEFAISTALSTSGMSPAALHVSKATRESRLHIEKPVSLRSAIQETRDELCSVYEERMAPNWDGFGAMPVTQDIYAQAYRVVEAIPAGRPQPTLGAEPDGLITLEWHRGPYRTLSVSVTADGDLHYAALIGTSRLYGTEAFLGDIPKSLLDLIDRVCTA